MHNEILALLFRVGMESTLGILWFVSFGFKTLKTKK